MPILGYWKIRGLVQPVRFILAYTETEYQEKWYEIGDDLSRQSWLKEKFKLGLELPNLPYWIEDPEQDSDTSIKLTQSRAILRHISREKDPNLLGRTPNEQRRIDNLDGHIFDFWTTLIMLCFRYTEESKDSFLESLPCQFELLVNFIGEHLWCVGDEITYVDFMLYESLYQHRAFLNSLNRVDILNQYPRLRSFMTRFETIPQIADYMKSTNYIQTPCYTKLAKYYI